MINIILKNNNIYNIFDELKKCSQNLWCIFFHAFYFNITSVLWQIFVQESWNAAGTLKNSNVFKVGQVVPSKFSFPTRSRSGGDQWHRINPEQEGKGGVRWRDRAGWVAAVSIGRGAAGSPLTNRTRRPPGPSISSTISQ